MAGRRRSSKQERRKKRRSRILGFMILTAAVLFFLLFFRLKVVHVTGNRHNSAEDVTKILLTKPTVENTLLTKLFNTRRSIPDPGFIESIDVRVLNRSEIRAFVTERMFVGCIKFGDLYWYFESDGKVMASTGERLPGDGIPYVTGISLKSDIKMGEVLPAVGSKQFSMLGILRHRIEANRRLEPDEAFFSEDGSLSLIYGNVTVLLGNGEKLELRLEELQDVLPTILNGYSGVLHLENYDGSQQGLVFDKKNS